MRLEAPFEPVVWKNVSCNPFESSNLFQRVSKAVVFRENVEGTLTCRTRSQFEGIVYTFNSDTDKCYTHGVVQQLQARISVFSHHWWVQSEKRVPYNASGIFYGYLPYRRNMGALNRTDSKATEQTETKRVGDRLLSHRLEGEAMRGISD